MADQNEKRLIVNRYTMWTIPNILTYIRFLLVPVYMTLVILSSLGGYSDYKSNLFLFLGLGIMALSASTDVIDGKIARKYKAGTKFGKHVVKHDQGSYLGQLIDPFADKAMHLGALVALCIAGYLYWVFIVVLLLRELCMVIVGAIVMNKINVQANMLGKVASATLSVGIILCFFHKFICQMWGDFGIDWIIVTIGLLLNWIAAVKYAVRAIKDLKIYKANLAGKEAELEKINIVEELEEEE
ncbi:MAG: CDP-alcohol phosphatidyltransferase family protein [Clostridia bacterium]